MGRYAEDEGKQGIAIRNQVYSCNSNKLVTEESEHLDYGVKANFYKEGIRLTELSRYCMEGSLLVPNEEINPLLLIFNLWGQHHNSLPGSMAYGHSWCGWLSTDYFEAGSEEIAFSISKNDDKTKAKAEKYKEEQKEAEAELNERLESKLSTSTLEAKISRFELELKYKNSGTKALLTEYDIKAIRDFVPLYRKRRKLYA